MRIAILILIVGGLIFLGWEKPLQEYSPWYEAPAIPAGPVADPAPVTRGAWMWDKNRKTTLDHHHATVPKKHSQGAVSIMEPSASPSVEP